MASDFNNFVKRKRSITVLYHTFCSIDRGNTEKERKNPYPSDLDGEWIGIQKTSDFIDKKSRGNFGGFTVSRRIPTPDSRPQQTNHCRAYELRQPTINRP